MWRSIVILILGLAFSFEMMEFLGDKGSLWFLQGVSRRGGEAISFGGRGVKREGSELERGRW